MLVSDIGLFVDTLMEFVFDAILLVRDFFLDIDFMPNAFFYDVLPRSANTFTAWLYKSKLLDASPRIMTSS